MKVFKYRLHITDILYIDMPKGAKMLDVQMQNGYVCLWALCDENNAQQERQIAIYGTGHPMPDYPGEYVATFQMDDGALVFHVFDMGLRQAA